MKRLKIALVGYGRMGQMIHRIVESRGHEVILTIDSPTDVAWEDEALRSADVAIEFTTPDAAAGNVRRLLALGIPVISGTTGWASELELIKQELSARGEGALLWASNFSIGVNLFFEINRQVARLMEHVEGYTTSLTETHHIHKLDAPSGTAITLAEEVIAAMPSRLESWQLDCEGTLAPERTLPITAIREGEVPGIHTLEYRSEVDRIELKHEAFGREGFATGAVVASEYLIGRTGFYTMSDLLRYYLEIQ